MRNVEKTTPSVARINIIIFCSNKSWISTWRAPANSKNDSIPCINILLKSIPSIIPERLVTNDVDPRRIINIAKIKDSIITPIVIGIRINLKFINIRAADMETRIEDVSKRLIR